MNGIKTILVILAAALFFVGGPVAGYAQSEQDDALGARKLEDVIPYGIIARQVESRFNGRVVGQKLRRGANKNWVYDLRILRNNGEVIYVVVNAHTGRVIRTKGR